MDFVVRDFNTIDNHIGNITLYLSNNHTIWVNILNIHEHGYFDSGQVWIYIKYHHEIDIYDTFMTILNNLTRDIFKDLLEIIQKNGNLDPTITVDALIPAYKDIIPVPDDFPLPKNVTNINLWGNCIEFTKETSLLLQEYEFVWDDQELYCIKGEIMQNGDFIYDKPIRSNNK